LDTVDDRQRRQGADLIIIIIIITLEWMEMDFWSGVHSANSQSEERPCMFVRNLVFFLNWVGHFPPAFISHRVTIDYPQKGRRREGVDKRICLEVKGKAS
jgi:hypothetical protein